MALAARGVDLNHVSTASHVVQMVVLIFYELMYNHRLRATAELTCRATLGILCWGDPKQRSHVSVYSHASHDHWIIRDVLLASQRFAPTTYICIPACSSSCNFVWRMMIGTILWVMNIVLLAEL